MVMGITPGRERGHCLLLAKLDRMGSQEANRKIKTVKFSGVDALRRILIFAITATLAAVGLAPLSMCAFLTSQMAECATPKTQSECDQMNMEESGTRLVAGSDTSCCLISNAPIAQSQYKESGLFLATPIAALDPMGNTPRNQREPLVLTVRDLSPPPLQSRLCTFLI